MSSVFSRFSTRAAAVAVAAAALACAPRPPATTPTIGRAHANQAPPPSAQQPSPPRYTAGHFVYDIRSVGIVSSPRDTTQPIDTVTTHSRLSYDARWENDKLHLVGQVQSRVTATSGVRQTSVRSTPSTPAAAGGAPATPSASHDFADAVPFEVIIDTASGTVGLPADSVAVPGCVTGGPAVEQDRALAADRPRSFDPGSAWTDTLTRISCLGGVPLTTRTARVASVAPALTTDPVSGASAILVTYHSQPAMEGEARRGRDLVTLHGAGVGTTELYYNQTTGVLLSAHNTTSIDLDFAINGRVQHLHQTADWRAALSGR